MTTAWLAAAAAAVVELDVASAGQLMISRPIVLGPALGFWLGDALTGAALGAFYELFSVGATPVGGRVPLNVTVATAAALLLALGPARLPVEAAFPAGLLTGFAHAHLEVFMRTRRRALSSWTSAMLSAGRDPKLRRVAAGELSLQAAGTFVVLAGVLVAAGPLAFVFAQAPRFAQTGLKAGLAMTPLIALASLMHSFRVIS